MLRTVLLRIALVLTCLLTVAVLSWPRSTSRGTGHAAQSRLEWSALLLPLSQGNLVASHHVLGAPRRGNEHDIVVSVRSTVSGSFIEVHVLDRGRWSGIRETASFGVAYETPRSSASIDDCEAVTETIANAIRANDPGGLGPVDEIPLSVETEPPVMARILSRLFGARGVVIGACLVLVTWALVTMPGGAWIVSIWLFSLGLALRVISLDLPFLHDQDIQRMFTGHVSVQDILTRHGVADRHPPLYFLVLHVVQIWGQSEAVGRAPAAVFGALGGPAMVWGASVLRRRLDIAALAGLALTLSVEMIARSREVSEITLFSLLVIVVSVVLARYGRGRVSGARTTWKTWTTRMTRSARGSWFGLCALSCSIALCFWTYYLAPFVIAGCVLTFAGFRKLPRPTLWALAIGLLAAAPALVLGVKSFLRDRPARSAADAHPTIAWGQHGIGELARQMTALSREAFGVVVLGAMVGVAVNSVKRRDVVPLTPIGGMLAAFVAIAILAPIARVQAYYVEAVLPLGLLAIALSFEDTIAARARSILLRVSLLVALVVSLVTHDMASLAAGGSLYTPSDETFMPGFAQILARSPDRHIATVAHYDSTLLAYYLARQRGVQLDWAFLTTEPDERTHILDSVGKTLTSLEQSHAGSREPDKSANGNLDILLETHSAIVIERDEFLLPKLHERLRTCPLIAESGPGRMYSCPALP